MTAVRHSPGPLAVVARTTVLVGALAAVAIFHVWCHTRVTAAGYLLGELQRTQESLRAERNRLEVEVATLRAPGRLEGFARARLGMAPPAPGAVVAGGMGEAAAGWAGTVGDGVSHRPGPAEPAVRRQDFEASRGGRDVHVAARERPRRSSAQ
jgi:cell division protein FtsL